MTLRLPAPAKLNLCLNITGRRDDGMHELQSAFQLIDRCDWLTFEPADELHVTCPALALPMTQNLVFRAAAALADAAGRASAGARIVVEKRIPDGGGLGGGSSDAATTLLALNHLWQLERAEDELAAIGLALGADIPFFVRGRSAWAEGVGERLQPAAFGPGWFVVVDPHVHVSTGEIFDHPGLTRHGAPITIARFLQQGAGNACEPLVRQLYPAVDEALTWLAGFGPAKMSGTGGCVFLPVDTKRKARDIAAAVPARWSAFFAEAIDRSPLHTALEREFGASPSW